MRIPTLRRTILELYQFLLCAEHIYSKVEHLHILVNKTHVLHSEVQFSEKVQTYWPINFNAAEKKSTLKSCCKFSETFVHFRLKKKNNNNNTMDSYKRSSLYHAHQSVDVRIKEVYVVYANMIFSDLRLIWFSVQIVEKATIRNRYNRNPHPALDTKWERNIYKSRKPSGQLYPSRWPPGFSK